MIVATLPSKNKKNRNGDLILVSPDHRRAVRAPFSLLEALQNWEECYPQLKALDGKYDFDLNVEECLSPLPNAPGFYDGSAFLSHVFRARKSRGDVMPPTAKTIPLMYQGVSDNFLPPTAPIELMNEAFGGDFEGEFAVIVGDVPKGTSAEKASSYIRFIILFNDITYRELIKEELPTKFGFLQSKPNSSVAPFALTPDELGSAWDGERVHLEVQTKLNGKWFGSPSGKEMHFGFGQLIAHACRTRPLSAGSIIGSGTVSNEDASKGYSCLTEKRCQEIIESGKESTPWLKKGDKVEMEVLANGKSLFGLIRETVV